MLSTSLASLLAEVFARVATITVFIVVGVGLANVAIEFGAVDRITALARPLTRPANLPPEVGTAILTTTASPTAGYGMLAEFRESGVLDDRATLIAVTMNTFFGFAQHIFTYYGPVLIPILGLKVGLLYVGARAAIALAITLVGVLAGALLLSADNVSTTVDLDPEADVTDGGIPPTVRAKLEAAARSTLSLVRGIVPRLLVIYVIVAVAIEWFDVESITAAADPLATVVGLPGAAVPVVAVLAIETTNGAIVLAPLIENGTFTARQAVATMLVGGIVSFAVSTFKRSIPFQYGIWGAEFGSKVIVVNTSLKIVFIAVAVVLLLVP